MADNCDFDSASGSSESTCALTAAATLRLTSESVYICIAADLLHQMMTELQRAELDNSRLAPVIAAARHDICRRLDLLLVTVESLVVAKNPTRVTDLSGRAKLMIYGLAREIEQLVIQAQGAGDPLIADST
jgi:hypothetical protein